MSLVSEYVVYVRDAQGLVRREHESPRAGWFFELLGEPEKLLGWPEKEVWWDELEDGSAIGFALRAA